VQLVPIREEAEHRERYDVRHQLSAHDVSRVVELEAVGTDYGNSGFTTRDQADRMAEALALTPDDTLLDVGAGSGWPGLYLASRTGCRVVVTDLSPAGMRRASRRATEDGLAARAVAVAASARQLPFRPEQFDAIVHTDVLC
jgi:cyclopropane fatty-acyl-phospholipid synthase-like methyltransferase